MFAKVVAVILSIGAAACLLLATRQARIQAAHDLADAQLRLMRLDNQTWELRARIASLVTPVHVQQLASRISPLKPIGGEFWVDPRAARRPPAPAPPDAPPPSVVPVRRETPR